jgi:hypothetical protein
MVLTVRLRLHRPLHGPALSSGEGTLQSEEENMAASTEVVGELLQVDVNTCILTIADEDGKTHRFEFDLGHYGDDYRTYVGMINLRVKCVVEDDKVKELTYSPAT